MTANELADWLDECDLYYTHTKHLGIVETESKFKKSATMLRTIPTLEKEINDVQKEYIRLAGKYQEVLIKLNSDIVYEPIIEQQAQEIEELKADAERYRYLRSHCYKLKYPNSDIDRAMELKFVVSGVWADNKNPEVLDGLIDFMHKEAIND